MNQPKKLSRSNKREFWQKQIECWQAGSLSQRNFCQQKGINMHQFSWWRSRGLKSTPKKAKVNNVTFVPAIIKEKSQSVLNIHNNIVLILPNQTKLILPHEMPGNDLLSLIKAIGGLS